MTDNVFYNASTGDRVPQVDILNYNPATASYSTPGTYDPIAKF